MQPTQADFHQVTYEKTIKSKTDPNREFILKPLTEEYQEAAAKLVSHAFCINNAVVIQYQIPEDIFYDRIALPVAKKAERQQIGTICIDKSTNKLVAAILNEDYATDKTEYFYTDPHPLLDKELRFLEVMEKETGDIVESFPKGRYETIEVSLIGTDRKEEKQGLVTQMLQFQMFEHPIIKLSKVLFSTTTHPATTYLMNKLGFKIVWEKEWKDFANIKGYEDFAEVDKIDLGEGKLMKKGIWKNVFKRE